MSTSETEPALPVELQNCLNAWRRRKKARVKPELPEWRKRMKLSHRRGHRVPPAKLLWGTFVAKVPADLTNGLDENAMLARAKKADTLARFEQDSRLSRAYLLEQVALKFDTVGGEYDFENLRLTSLALIKNMTIRSGCMFSVVLETLMQHHAIPIAPRSTVDTRAYLRIPLEERVEKQLLYERPTTRGPIIEALGLSYDDVLFLLQRNSYWWKLTGVVLAERWRKVKCGEVSIV